MDDSEQEDELATPTQQIAKLIAVTWQHISIPLTYQAENVGERFKVLAWIPIGPVALTAFDQ